MGLPSPQAMDFTALSAVRLSAHTQVSLMSPWATARPRTVNWSSNRMPARKIRAGLVTITSTVPGAPLNGPLSAGVLMSMSSPSPVS